MTIAIILGIIGLLLVYVEFFVPGGVAVVIGGFFLITSVVWFGIQTTDPTWSFVYLFIVIVLVILVCKLALRHIRASAKKHTWYADQDQEGYIATSFDKDLIGKTGTSLSNLKPSGHILIEGKQVQALSEEGYIEEGTKVQVTGGRGSHLIVKPIK